MGSTGNTYLERAIALKVDGHYEEAVEALKRHIEADPNSSEGHYQLGLVYGYTGLFDESLEELKHSVMLDPSRLDFRNDLALTYSMTGMYDEAKSEFEEVLRREPNNEKALQNIVFFNEPA